MSYYARGLKKKQGGLIRGNIAINTYIGLWLASLLVFVPQYGYEQKEAASQDIQEEDSSSLSQKEKNSSAFSVLEKIAWCESKGKQFGRGGNVIRGKNPNDVGKYQINQIVWGEKARMLGYDLHTEEGNEAMALVIFEAEGAHPWRASRHCWDT